MPRIETTTRTLYQFDELTDKAKEAARDWLREASLESGDIYPFEHITDEFSSTIAPAFGFSGAGRHKLPAVNWSGFSSQGDGANFAGCWSLDDVRLTVLADFPAGVGCKSNDDLHTLAGHMAALCAELHAGFPADDDAGPMDATITARGHYSHEYEMRIESDRLTDDQQKALLDISRTLARWLYRQLEAENYYIYSAEYIDEEIRANEYEFLETGKKA